MDIKQEIENIGLTYALIREYVDRIDVLIRSKKFVEGPTIDLIFEAIAKCGSHPMLVRLLADCLQLVDDETIYGQYGLEEIRQLHDTLLELNPYDISYWSDLANYEYAILDENVRAEETARLGISRAREQIKGLEHLRVKISEE